MSTNRMVVTQESRCKVKNMHTAVMGVGFEKHPDSAASSAANAKAGYNSDHCTCHAHCPLACAAAVIHLIQRSLLLEHLSPDLWKPHNSG
jgi:hypothetical protein